MSRRCFFIENMEPGSQIVTLNPDVSHHARNVVRVKDGHEVELRDGRGNSWLGIVAQADDRSVQVRVTGTRPSNENEPNLKIALFMALASPDKMEVAFRQVTELGVHRFVIFRSGRSQYDLGPEKLHRRVERLTRIGREAMCQCGRTKVPEVLMTRDLSEALERPFLYSNSTDTTLKIVANEAENRHGLEYFRLGSPYVDEVMGFVGPEGGWTEGEVRLFEKHGYASVGLGPRILRLETAAVALVTSLQLLWGDLG